MNLSPDHFFQSVIQASVHKRPECHDPSKQKLLIKDALKEALGDFSDFANDDPVSTLEITEKNEFAEYIRERAVFESLSGLNTSMYILTPESNPVNIPLY